MTDEEGMSSTTYVVIPIQDANDKNPYFMQNLYSFSLPENEPAGKYLLVVTFSLNHAVQWAKNKKINKIKI